MITKDRALELVRAYADENYRGGGQALLPRLHRFEAGWLAHFDRADGQGPIGGATLLVDGNDGSITTYASGMPPRRIIEMALATKRKRDRPT